MKRLLENKVAAVAILACVFIILSIVMADQKTFQAEEDAVGTVFLPELQPRLNDIVAIHVQKSGKHFRVERGQDGKWLLVTKNNYPVDIVKVRDLILNIADFSIIEKKTSNPERFKDLGVEMPKDGSDATQITFHAEDGSKIVDIILGKQRLEHGTYHENGAGNYVRKVGEDQAWLVDGHLHVDLSSKALLQAELFAPEYNDIKKMERKFLTDAKDFIIEKYSKTSAFVLTKPKNTPLKNSSDLTMLGGLSDYTFDKVKKASDITFKRKETITSIFETFDGLVLTYRAYAPKKDELWVKINASSEKEDLQEKVKKINDLVSNWAYKVAPDDAEYLRRRVRDMVE